MSYWSELRVKDVIIDLSHLEPFEFSCTARDYAEPATVSVRFNDHCFTKTFDPRLHVLADCITTRQSARHERRVFCDIRYELSLSLPLIIRALGDKRVASTREGNMVRVEAKSGEAYAVFFTLRRHNARRADLFVVSAYPLDKGKRPADTGEMKFDLALVKILRGEKAKFPNRR